MRVLAIFCAAFAAGVALSQYLLSAQWTLILCGVFAAAALVMGLCGCANKRGDWAKRAFLCALGLAFAFGYNTLYAHFIKAPNDALLGTQDAVEVELLGYAEETSHGAKVTVKILNRGLPGRAIYYGDADLMDLEPGAHVTAEALFNSAIDPTGKGLHLRNFTAKGIYILLYQRGDPTYDDTNAGALKYLPQLGAACAFVPALGIRAVLAIAGLLEELPFHAIYFNTAFSVAWLAYVYAIFITCALAKRGKYRYFAAVGLSVLSLFAAAKVNALHYEQGGLNVVALDVGQGESVLLISEGHAALVDCGSKNSYIDAGAIAADYLRSAGATLDSVVLTHYHEDHANGLAALFARVDVDTIYLADIDAGEGDRDEVEALAERYGVNIHYVTEVTDVENGASTMSIYPPLGEKGANELGLTILCSLGDFDTLITGDMDTKTETKLVETYDLPDIEVLLVGHHGSKYSTGTTLLESVTPEAGVISVGDNSYGHPTEEALLRLTDAGMTVYRTDMQGNILITVD